MRNVIVCAEHNLLMQLCVSLTAFCEHNGPDQFHIYVVRTGLSQEEKQWLTDNLAFAKAWVTYLDIQEVTLENIAAMMPETEEHALFLDYLTLVYGNLAPVYDALEWSDGIAIWHELGLEQQAAGVVVRYEYGEPWLDTYQLADSGIWWQYAKKTPHYIPLMETFMLDTVRNRKMSRMTYAAYDEYEALTPEYKRYKAFFDENYKKSK